MRMSYFRLLRCEVPRTSLGIQMLPLGRRIRPLRLLERVLKPIRKL